MQSQLDDSTRQGEWSDSSRRWLVRLLVLALALASVWGFVETKAAQTNRRAVAFGSRSKEIFDLLTQEFGSYEELVLSLDSFFAASEHVGREEFALFVRRSLAHQVGVQAVSWLPRVRAQEREKFEAEARAEGLPDYSFQRWRPGEVWKARAKHWAPEYYPVFYLEPTQGNEHAFGIDLYSSPVRREALEKARDTGAATATGRLTLAQAGGEAGYLLVVPVYEQDAPTKSVQERRDSLHGFVTGVFNIRILVNASLARITEQRGIAIRIHDITGDEDDTLLYEGSLNRDRAAMPKIDSILTRSHQQSIGGRAWRFEFLGTKEFDIGQTRSLAWLVLFGGLTLAALTFAILSRAMNQTRRVEALVRRRTDELERASDALAKSNVELQQFAYIASHDLQAPLRGIAGFTEFLQDDYKGKLDERADEYIGHIVTGVGRMQTMIDDLLSLSRADSQTKPFADISMNTIFDDALDIIAHSIEEAQAQVTRDELPVVLGDRALLVQLLQNLLSNGIKFHGKDVPRVHVSAQSSHTHWEFAVHDNGIGIDPKHAERIFEVFRRLHTQREFAGTGIGLAVCRRIVNRHEGRIWVTANKTQGSTFHFTIPKAATSTP